MTPIEVLIADDDAASREAVASAVRSLGYGCRTAADGRTALEEYGREPTAIVVTDWLMPRLSGLELCKELKRRVVPPYVIMMTGFEDNERFYEAIREGADEFLRKPIILEELEVRLLAAVRLVRTQMNLAELNERLRRDSERDFRSARTDPLTSIGNRLRLDEDLARAVADAGRYGRRYSVALCDVDLFKRYNDVNGHLAGDAALQQIAGALQAGVRSTDSVYRYGGEEFLILLPEQSAAEASLAMDRARARVEGLALPRARGTSGDVLTLSAGVAELGDESKEAWLARADAALYRAKAEGRNRVRLAA